jgi:hypothetical protein
VRWLLVTLSVEAAVLLNLYRLRVAHEAAREVCTVGVLSLGRFLYRLRGAGFGVSRGLYIFRPGSGPCRGVGGFDASPRLRSSPGRYPERTV